MNTRVLFIDCQSSGTTPAHGDMIELSWQIKGGAEVLLPLKSFVLEASSEIPARILRMTGLCKEDLDNAQPPSAVYNELCRDIRAFQPECAVTHFARFERGFLDDFYQTHGEKNFPLSFICTHELAKRIVANLPSYSLRAVAGHFDHSTEALKRSAHHIEAIDIVWQHLSKCFDSMDALRASLQEKAPKRSSAKSFSISREFRLGLPNVPGVYRFLSAKNDVLYVGKATSLKSRVNSYFRGRKSKGSRLSEMLTRAKDMQLTEMPSALEAAIYENHLIKSLQPPYNEALKNARYEMLWTDRTFSEFSAKKTVSCSVGPFPGSLALEQIHALHTSLIDQRVLFSLGFAAAADTSIDIISAGLNLFISQLKTDGVDTTNLRSCLAWGMRIIREQAKQDDVKEDDIDSEEDTAAEDERDLEITPEFVQGYAVGILMQTARLLLRARKLSALMSSQVRFRKDRAWRTLVLENAKVVGIGAGKGTKSFVDEVENPIRGLDLGYDGLRIILTETNRLHIR